MSSSERAKANWLAEKCPPERQLAEQAEELAILQKAAAHYTSRSAWKLARVAYRKAIGQSHSIVKAMCRVTSAARSGWYKSRLRRRHQM